MLRRRRFAPTDVEVEAALTGTEFEWMLQEESVVSEAAI
jgi:hypothetical protein